MESDSDYDLQAIRRLDGFESDGQSLVAALFQELRRGGRADVDQLGVAVQQSQYEQAKQLAHSLKSSGRALGLNGFGDACERLEQADPVRSDFAAMHQDLDQRFEAGCRWLVGVLAGDQVEGA